MIITARFAAPPGVVSFAIHVGSISAAAAGLQIVRKALREFAARGIAVRREQLTLVSLSNERRAIDAGGRQLWATKGV